MSVIHPGARSQRGPACDMLIFAKRGRSATILAAVFITGWNRRRKFIGSLASAALQ